MIAASDLSIVISEDFALHFRAGGLSGDRSGERMKLSRLLWILNPRVSVRQGGDERLISVFREFVLFGRNDEHTIFYLSAALIKVAQFMAVCSEPIGLFGLRAEINIIEARRLECSAKVSRLRAFLRLARRAAKDDLLNQFSTRNGRIVARGFDQLLVWCQPLFFARLLSFISAHFDRFSLHLLSRLICLARSFLRVVEGSFKSLAEASGMDFLGAVFPASVVGEHLFRQPAEPFLVACFTFEVATMEEQMEVRIISVAMNSRDPAQVAGLEFTGNLWDGFARDFSERLLARRIVVAEALEILFAEADRDVDHFVLCRRAPLGQDSLRLPEAQGIFFSRKELARLLSSCSAISFRAASSLRPRLSRKFCSSKWVFISAVIANPMISVRRG